MWYFIDHQKTTQVSGPVQETSKGVLWYLALGNWQWIPAWDGGWILFSSMHPMQSMNTWLDWALWSLRGQVTAWDSLSYSLCHWDTPFYLWLKVVLQWGDILSWYWCAYLFDWEVLPRTWTCPPPPPTWWLLSCVLCDGDICRLVAFFHITVELRDRYF